MHAPLPVPSSLVRPIEASFAALPFSETLASSADGSPSPAKATREEVHTAFPDRYELMEHLGSGGMGEVFAAFDRILGERVALKLAADTPLARRRLPREARLLGRFAHPNVVSVLDVGTTRSGRPYYSMDLIDGVTLRDLVKRSGPISELRAGRILQKLCDALSAVHGAGLVHHDVTPSNVMVQTGLETEVDDVCLIDFGIARSLEATRLSTAVVGTPGYMPPEVNIGAASDQRADIYALGAVGSFLLDGVRLDATRAAAKQNTVSGTYRRTSPLERVLARCLAIEPSDRFESATDVTAAVEEALSLDDTGRPRLESGVEINRNSGAAASETTLEERSTGSCGPVARFAESQR